MTESTNHDRWMVSYADFITVLFAFFVVLFASAYQENHSIKNVSKAIHYGFVDLESFSSTGGTSAAAPSQLLSDRSGSTHRTENVKSETSDATAATGIDIEELRGQLEAAIGRELKDGQVTMSVTPEGFVISLKDLGFFDSGQAIPRPGAAGKIDRIARVLAQHGLYLRVEGHSDNQPIHTAQFDSNWELSTARAMAVLTLLINQSGLDPGRISLAGYGQYRPIADNASADGRKMNRRVDLVVVGRVEQQHP